MDPGPRTRLTKLCLGALLMAASTGVMAQEAADLDVDPGSTDAATEPSRFSGKLLLTGGVSQVEGSGGGGLTPWALIGGDGTGDQVGGSAYYTQVRVDDYQLDSYGALIGLFDRVELSLSRQAFDTRDVGE